MARVHELHGGTLSHRDAPVRPGVARLGERCVHPRDHLQRVHRLRPAARHAQGEALQDAAHLVLLGVACLAPTVRAVHVGERLDEERRAGVGGAVDDAGHPALEVGLHRQHEPAAAHRVEPVLQHLRAEVGVDEGLHALGRAVIGVAALGAELAQQRAGVVLQLAGRGQLRAQIALQRAQVRDVAREVPQQGRLRARRAPERLRRSGGVEAVGHGDELAAGEGAAHGGALDQRTRVVGERERRRLVEQERGLGGLLLQFGDRRGVVDGGEREHAFAGHRRAGMARQRLADAGELQEFQRPLAQFRPRRRGGPHVRQVRHRSVDSTGGGWLTCTSAPARAKLSHCAPARAMRSGNGGPKTTCGSSG